MTATATDLRVYSPFPVEALPRIGFWLEPVRHRMTDDFGPQSVAEIVNLVGGRMAKGMQTWAVERDGELGGFISVSMVSPIVAQVNCMFRQEFFKHCKGDDALRQVFRELFAGGEVLKIVCEIFKDNTGIRNMCERIGMEREGTLRKHTMRGGRLADVLVIGITKEAFEKCSDSI